jgi:L-threonylcarbamoyladenylate synthase
VLSVINLLKAGDIVALPTETVYGLAGRCDKEKTIKNIYQIKNRPKSNPLIVHYSNSYDALKDIYIDSRAIELANKFWPGPLSIVAKIKNKSICKLVLSNLDTVAVRVPSNKIMLNILDKLGVPLAAPSANRYGKISPTSASDVYEELNGKVSTILDGGLTAIGLESTVIDLSSKETKILRHGGINMKELNNIVSIYKENKKKYFKKNLSPGLSNSHYKPDASLRINANSPNKNEAWLAFGKIPKSFKGIGVSLSKKKCLKESAKNLYKMLRILDKAGLEKIAVQKIPEKGIGIAINDRLKRASYSKIYNKNE